MRRNQSAAHFPRMTFTSNDKEISFSGSFNGAVVGYDHLNCDKHDALVYINIYCSDKTVKIIHGEEHSYINKIRKSFVL